MSAKDYLEALERRYRYLALRNANGALSRKEALELLNLQEGRKRVGKPMSF